MFSALNKVVIPTLQAQRPDWNAPRTVGRTASDDQDQAVDELVSTDIEKVVGSRSYVEASNRSTK